MTSSQARDIRESIDTALYLNAQCKPHGLELPSIAEIKRRRKDSAWWVVAIHEVRDGR